MDFSNRSEDANDNVDRYIDHLLTLLEQRDPWELQEEQLGRIEQLIRGMDDAGLRAPEKPGKWSVL